MRRRNIGQKIREDGPKSHVVKAGTPTMGGMLIMLACDLRLLDRPRRGLPDLHAQRGPGPRAHRRLRADRLRRRPHRRAQLAQPRPQQADEVRGTGARRRRVCARGVQVGGRDDHALVHPVRRPGLAHRHWCLGRVRRVRRGRHRERGEPGRRTRRAGRGLVDVLLLRARRDRLLGVPPLPRVPLNQATALDLAIVAASLVGGCLGFLWWNAPPAKIIMGDTGSLAIGAGLAGLCLL